MVATNKTAQKVIGAAVIGGGIGAMVLLATRQGTKTATLTGGVVSGEDGSPISGAHVECDTQEATTGSSGVFKIQGLPRGKTLQINITAEGYLDYTDSIILELEENYLIFQLFAKVGTAGLVGTVSDINTGQPLSGVKVATSNKTVYTDSNGNYCIYGLLAGGTISVTFELKDLNAGLWYKTETKTITLQKGTNTIDVGMDNFGMIAFTIQDLITYEPIEGATVSSEGQSATTNRLGQCSLVLNGGYHDITVKATGYEDKLIEDVLLEPGITEPMFIYLQKTSSTTGTVSGTVKNSANENPIVGAYLVFSNSIYGSFDTYSSTLGAYQIELPSVTSGVVYSITATKDGYITYTGSVTVRAGSVSPKNITMTPVAVENGRVAGAVYDNYGLGLQGVKVELDPINRETYSEAGGYFTFEDVPPGDYTIWGYLEGFGNVSKEITVSSGKTTAVTLIMNQGGNLGFFLAITDWYQYHPTAQYWWAELGSFYSFWKGMMELWDSSGEDLTEHPWPQTLKVDIYDRNYQLLGHRVLGNVTLQNGHVYSYYFHSNILQDEGTF